MGASPRIQNESWSSLNPWCLVEYSVGESDYAILRQGKQFTLFSDGELAGSTRSVSTGVTPFFSESGDFRLILSDRKKQPTIPPPAFYFVPYYIDQDSGWTGLLSSFARLGQFTRWHEPVLQYHAGIRDNRWFELEAQVAAVRESRKEPSQSIRALKAVKEDIENLLETLPIEIDLSSFQSEVERLTKHVSELHEVQQRHRSRQAKIVEQESILKAQIEILTRAASEIDADIEFASVSADEVVNCPTCKAEYHNDFADRFSLAEDQDRCLDLRYELKAELDDVFAAKDALDQSMDEVEAAIDEVSQALDQQLGELTLRDITRMRGKQELRAVVQQRLNEAQSTLADIDAHIGRLEDERKAEALKAQSRKTEITTAFTRRLCDYARRLGLSDFADSVPNRLYFNVKETGSERPRAILAYTLAFYVTAKQYSPCAVPPLIVDSPRQQDLDPDNWERVVSLISEEFPDSGQLILATVSGESSLHGAMRYELNEPKGALRSRDYHAAAEAMRPYLVLAEQ